MADERRQKYEEIMKADKQGYRKWNFEATEMEESGYEDLMDELEAYKPEDYLAADEENRKRIQREVLEIYRRKNIYPITYYNRNGIFNEIKRCIDYKIRDWSDSVNEGAGVGTGLCNFLFPNLYDVVAQKDLTKSKEGGETAYRKFYNDDFLMKSIRVSLEYGASSPTPSSIYSSMGLVGQRATNFRPMNARKIYEMHTEYGDTVLDTSCGFGGRLLGALSSEKNLTYVGCDPNTETQLHLRELGTYIEQVTGRTGSYHLFTEGSEEFNFGENTVDFAFSSPPYFDLELYSTEETQSVNKFPTLEEWLEGFVRGTVRNIYKMLKPGKYCCINIADFELPGGQVVNFVDEWVRISEEEGFERVNNLYLEVPTRGGSLEKKLGEGKTENILRFKSLKKDESSDFDDLF